MATQALTHSFLVGLLEAGPRPLFPKQKQISSLPLFEEFMWLIQIHCHKHALAVFARVYHWHLSLPQDQSHLCLDCAVVTCLQSPSFTAASLQCENGEKGQKKEKYVLRKIP